MYKLTTEFGYILKSYDIGELWKLIVSNPNWTFQFFLNYTPVSHDEFLKIYLNETQDFKNYLSLFRSLKPTIKIENYGTETQFNKRIYSANQKS